ncbi:MAG: 30S ribosomal protein S9, partial [Anaerolineae bacterium]
MEPVVYAATGKRKTSVARVRIMPGTGVITVNGKDAKEYFERETLLLMVRAPLVETGTEGRYDVIARIYGGGKSGQAGALK